MRRSFIVLSLLILACDGPTPTALIQSVDPASRVALVSDGTRPGGDPGFRWLPPISEKSPRRTGTFNADRVADLSLQICVFEGRCRRILHEAVGAHEGPVSDVIRVNSATSSLAEIPI